MRFLENGPDIPDELLNARDEGRVCFLCGAGLSRAFAKLQDFKELTTTVLSELGARHDSAASISLERSGEISKKFKQNYGSYDRIFNEMLYEFSMHDIQCQVAQCLKPKPKADLKGHKLILDLAKTPDKRYQVVTTNYDRLFEDCVKSIQAILPSDIPRIFKTGRLDGIVYLHGAVDKKYKKTEDDEFVLTSSDFGNAYLLNGWATEFLEYIFTNYIVVIFGYSADDPPVQYVLDALGRNQDKSHAYTFISEFDDNYKAWQSKSVTPIVYAGKDKDDYSVLWDSLEKWAQRARHPNRWYDGIISKAYDGPRAMRPFQRGQVFHIASSVAGLKRIIDHKKTLPAEWLCVFDPKCRYASPDRLWYDDNRAVAIDPYEIYCIDTDVDTLDENSKKDYFDNPSAQVKREIPLEAKDLYAGNTDDTDWGTDTNRFSFRFHNQHERYSSFPRHLLLADWLVKVIEQPATLWWVVRQEMLHIDVYLKIVDYLRYNIIEGDNNLFNAWRLVVESRINNIFNL